MRLSNRKVERIIAGALNEDKARQDITSQFFVPSDEISDGYIIVKENAVICGLDLAKKVFKKLDKNISFHSSFHDGKRVKKNTKIAFLKGKTHALLAGERVALNFLGYLSGISTKTSKFVDKIRPCKALILDTRKTTPGLRILEKYAVRCGGGVNHRNDLNETFFIKDNHRAIYKNLTALGHVIQRAKKQTKKIIQVEVDNLTQLRKILEFHPHMILLDNMNTSQIKKALRLTRALPKARRPLIEASGGITLNNVRAIARTGVDRISIGELTHSRQSINFSMELT